jgi:hypothetical protein
VQRFYYYQLLIKAKLNNYVNADSLALLKELQDPLCEVYNKEEQRHYNKISRLLVQYFLTREYDSIILTSVRVNSDKKLDHLIMKRKILEKISEMFSTDWPYDKIYNKYIIPYMITVYIYLICQSFLIIFTNFIFALSQNHKSFQEMY